MIVLVLAVVVIAVQRIETGLLSVTLRVDADVEREVMIMMVMTKTVTEEMNDKVEAQAPCIQGLPMALTQLTVEVVRLEAARGGNELKRTLLPQIQVGMTLLMLPVVATILLTTLALL